MHIAQLSTRCLGQSRLLSLLAEDLDDSADPLLADLMLDDIDGLLGDDDDEPFFDDDEPMDCAPPGAR